MDGMRSVVDALESSFEAPDLVGVVDAVCLHGTLGSLVTGWVVFSLT